MKIDRAEAARRARLLAAILSYSNQAAAITTALLAVRDETAAHCAEVGSVACHLPELEGDDKGGCIGCESGWCQSAVDAACIVRNQFAEAIRAAYAPVTKQGDGQ